MYESVTISSWCQKKSVKKWTGAKYYDDDDDDDDDNDDDDEDDDDFLFELGNV